MMTYPRNKGGIITTKLTSILDVNQASSPKIAVIIPTFNEERTLELVVKEIESLNLPTTIIVTDGGSVDGTVQIAKELGTSVIFEEGIGRGISFEQTLRNAFKAISSDTDIVVLIDADGEIPASIIPELIKPIIIGRSDMVLGSTYQSSSPLGKILMKLYSLLSVFFGSFYITDPLTIFRAYSIKALGTFKLNNTGGVESTLLRINPQKNKLRFEEIPVSKRLRHVRYKGSYTRYFIKFLKECLSI